MPIPLKPFYMIRHGESTANRDGYFSGIQDVMLTEKGREQARDAQPHIKKLKVKPTLIIHSHLRRAIDTAKIINEPYDFPMIQNNNLGEQAFGDWEKQSWEAVRERWLTGENPPNGEANDAFFNRVKKGFNEALFIQETTLIVCHGGVFRAFNKLHGREGNAIENAKLYHFEPMHDMPEFPWKITLIE